MANTRRRRRKIRRVLNILLPLGVASLVIVLYQPWAEMTKDDQEHHLAQHVLKQQDDGNEQLYTDVFFSSSEAYMGIDADGQLTLFEGPPHQKKPIETFFQLDIEHLETSLPHETVSQLYEGIRVRDMEEYSSVLSTMNDFMMRE